MADNYFESDGKAVNVTINATVEDAKEAIYAEGWLGLAGSRGASGDTIACIIDRREYQVVIPDSVAPVKGDTIYVTLASVTATVVPDGAWSKTSGAGKKAFLKVTEAPVAYPEDGSYDVVTGILLPEGV